MNWLRLIQPEFLNLLSTIWGVKDIQAIISYFWGKLSPLLKDCVKPREEINRKQSSRNKDIWLCPCSSDPD
jgi:hypothetical protein